MAQTTPTPTTSRLAAKLTKDKVYVDGSCDVATLTIPTNDKLLVECTKASTSSTLKPFTAALSGYTTVAVVLPSSKKLVVGDCDNAFVQEL
ncbi:hypothetical protein PINS_up020457 [Pythium insidiosum]|nr:hypothetical protein PINS_up020457 [Pythium insidiosum]